MDLNRKYDFAEGELLLIDKPTEWTSFDVVNKVRHSLRFHLGIRKIKVGHAGTLDPLATGLLLVCVGKATKKINEYTGLDKEYTGTFYIGATTPSYDTETEVDQEFETSHITEDHIRDATKEFIGHIKQTPPAYSAIKVDGKRAYRLARGNEKVSMPEREVQIMEFEVTRAGIPETDFRVECAKGTYIRSLAFDFGKSLKSGAYIHSLRRTRIGDFGIEEALTVQQLDDFLAEQAKKEASY